MKSRLAIAAALLLVPTSVLATAVVSESIEQMARGVPLIVRGRVGQVQPQLDESGGRIWTYADIQVLEVLRGRAASSLLVKQPGGEIGRKGMRVAGAPKFTGGQETVLFLEPAADERNVWIIHTLAAGKVDFELSKKGELRAVRRLEGLAFFKPGGISVVHPEEDLGTPQQFLTRVRAALGGER